VLPSFSTDEHHDIVQPPREIAVEDARDEARGLSGEARIGV
jgi:hypothetical protein